MADAAVEFLLENLKQLLVHHTRLIEGAKGQLEILEDDLSMFKAFLEEHSTEKRNKNKALKELMRQIRVVVYEAEDIIDAFVTQAAENKARSYFTRVFHGQATLRSLSKKVEAIVPKVKHIYDKSRTDFAALRIGSVSDAGMEHKKFKQNKVPRVREDNLVGLEDEAETLIWHLCEETAELDVISIIGMPGLGKTTLAGKVFRNQKIQYEFPTRIWVSISQEYNKRDVFLAIMSNLIDQHSRTAEFRDVLRNFINVGEEDNNMTLKSKVEKKTDDELARMACQYLGKIKFLIVMDDVWTAEAWKDLEVTFPKLTRGKILVTSRNEEVARQANRIREPHKPRLLTDQESWELLQLEVFGKPKCHRDLEELGKTIAKQCRGMPLAIVVIGGILVKKASATDIRRMKDTWKKVSENLGTYISMDTQMDNIIDLSYNKLPYYLRPCFLYIGMFPEDFEIPVWQLSSLWIAEGLIQRKGEISLEEIAQDYLEELISRNLVMVGKIGSKGKIKTCSIHDMLREFCQKEAGIENENFFQEMKSSDGDFKPSITEIEKSRRLCIHTNILNFISSKPHCPRVRSFLSFSREEIPIDQFDNISFIHAAFKLLRVLNVQPFVFAKFPNDLTKLVHLRHVTLSGNFRILPRAISKLWNLHTLTVHTKSLTLEIKANIWKMIQLRHVKTNRSATLPKPCKSTKECQKLQTLGMISAGSCTEYVFDRVRSLRKLGIGGRLVQLLDVKGLEKLDNLENLKLENERRGGLSRLPKFPPKLRSLTISGTFLDWSHMSILAMLGTLEVLKLKNYAFWGESWETTDGGFRNLEVLHMDRLDLHSWMASAHSFPRLRCLVLRELFELKEIPSGLSKNLEQLELVFVSSSVRHSAEEIWWAKIQQQHGETSGSRGCKLFVDGIDYSL